MSEAETEAELVEVNNIFSRRHQGLTETFLDHAALVTPRIDSDVVLSKARRLLLGAYFSHEYAIEGAALCNPSIVLHPQQPQDGPARFVLSVRGVGEGHRSSIGFRTGTVSANGDVSMDPTGQFPITVHGEPDLHHQTVFKMTIADVSDDSENAAFVLDPLPALFDGAALQERIEGLSADIATRRNTSQTIDRLHFLANSSYRVEFPVTSEISERVLWPHAAAERHGMEDARFVRFVDDDASITYYGTYTAFDGVNIAQHLLQTQDFQTFHASAMAGSAASGKGLALFPRKINGRFVALSRSDRETNSVAFSDDIRCWSESAIVQVPERPWEVLQLGNCGSPIETDRGWLVLTHGVGPMRTYSLGAMLLDLHDPTRVLARSATPLLSPGPNRRDGYVPNVVYTCGALAHKDTLVIPYGIADQRIEIATVSISALLDSLL